MNTLNFKKIKNSAGKIFALIFLALSLLFSASCALEHTSDGNALPVNVASGHITPVQAYELIERYFDGGSLILLDVRTPAEFQRERIKGALNIDFYSAGFRSDLEKLDREKIYILYCRTGRRSDFALNLMSNLGFKRFYNMLEGIEGWKRRGYPTVTGSE